MVRNNQQQKTETHEPIRSNECLSDVFLDENIIDSVDRIFKLKQNLEQLTPSRNSLLKGIDLKKRVLIKDDCGHYLTGIIEDITKETIQLKQVPERKTNISFTKICTIRNLTIREENNLNIDLPPLLNFW